MRAEFVEEVPGVMTKAYETPEPEWAADLKARPREWAVVERFGPDKTKANSYQQKISQRYWKWMENYKGGWESKYRKYGNGYEVFARYMP